MEKTQRTSPWSRNRKLQVLAVVLPFTLLVFSGLVTAGPLLVGFTPTSYQYLALIIKVPTPTPTPTVTPTVTPVPPPVVPPGSSSVSGTLTREDLKPTYATKCEDVWFYEVIHNNDASRSLLWGILGVAVRGPNTDVFHTSWSAPDGVFTLNPNCFGPLGMPCSGSADGAKHRDAIGGYRPDSRLLYPGTYNLTLAICLSDFNACAHGAGTWRELSTVSIVAVDWAGCPSGPASAAAPTPTPDPLAGCRLDRSDPNRIHLVCPGK